jgi:hypothetical protein
MLPQRVLMTTAEAEAVRRSFVRRQLGVLVLSALTFAEFIAAIAINQWTLLLKIVFATLGVVMVVGSILIWRCPRCGESFGRNWLVTQCPHCFAALTKRKQSSRPSA